MQNAHLANAKISRRSHDLHRKTGKQNLPGSNSSFLSGKTGVKIAKNPAFDEEIRILTVNEIYIRQIKDKWAESLQKNARLGARNCCEKIH